MSEWTYPMHQDRWDWRTGWRRLRRESTIGRWKGPELGHEKEKSQPRMLRTFGYKVHEHVVAQPKLTISQGAKTQIVSHTPQKNKTVGCRVKTEARRILMKLDAHTTTTWLESLLWVFEYTAFAIVQEIKKTKSERVHIYMSTQWNGTMNVMLPTKNIFRRGYRGATNAKIVLFTRLQENFAKLMIFFVR